MREYKNIKNIAATIILIISFFCFGVYLGFNRAPEIQKVTNISNRDTEVGINADFSKFWKVWNTIDKKYPDASKIDAENRVNGAISGLVGSLNDPYSVYFNADETKSFKEDIAGNFGGIGAEVGKRNKILTVISPLKGTPAYKAGLKAGDKILKIDKKDTSDLTIEEAVKLMRGEKGTTVSLTIYHDGDKIPKEIKIVRDIIEVPTLDTEMRSDGIFVIKLYSFTENSASLFRDAVKKFSEAKTDKLVLDLRGNPGGYLDSAVDMASWFLPNGKPVVIEDSGNKFKKSTYRSKGYDVFTDKLKFVILIDEGSASASEILAGAMQDYKLAKLVGAQSFGKGSVQEVVDITPETILKITVAKWLTPNGTSISEKGLTPDYKIEITEKEITNKKDPQMNKAIELLTNWQK